MLSIILAGADYCSTTRILTLKGTHSRIGVQVPMILDEFAEVKVAGKLTCKVSFRFSKTTFTYL